MDETIKSSLNEDKIQSKYYISITNDFPLSRLCLFAVPNGGSRDMIEALKMQATGTVPGVADMIFLWQKDGIPAVYWFEFKDDTGRLSKQQEFFHENLRLFGFEVFVFRTANEAYNKTKSIMMADPLTEEQIKTKQDILARRLAYLKLQKQKRRY